ncbi:hypothetical protein [Sediminitomix flava]|uniref:Uncharacterized protein n=1 Tax=Sediminitomix flava TaxID=379075 RepID=A0A315ZI81_SEDFL|nr:hypothetical protein [Sediminitomix flava]PWJ32684.1 hypothetical protein BC781_1202 [Sediminitomix flava]
MLTEILIETIVIPIGISLIFAIFHYLIIDRKNRNVYKKSYFPTLAEQEAKEKKVRRGLSLYFLGVVLGVGITFVSTSQLMSFYHKSLNEVSQVILIPNILIHSLVCGFIIAVPISIFLNNIRKRLKGNYFQKGTFSLSKFFAYLFLILSISFSYQTIRKGVYVGESQVTIKDFFSDDRTVPIDQVMSISHEKSLTTLHLENGPSILINDMEFDSNKILRSKEIINLNKK